MSYEFDETYALYQESVRLARKEHVCSACKEIIRKGDKYARVFIVDSEGPETLKRCAR